MMICNTTSIFHFVLIAYKRNTEGIIYFKHFPWKILITLCFGRRKYHRGHPVNGIVCVWRESGKTFLVPVPDRTADTSMAVIDAWIEPGATVISDCWEAYRDLDAEGYTHRTVNHSNCFVDERTGAHTNTIMSTWLVWRIFWALTTGMRTTYIT